MRVPRFITFLAFLLRMSALACFASFLSAEQVIFTELQYNAQKGKPEFIEISNNTGTPLDIGAWYFPDGIEYTFPDFDPADTDAHIFRPFEIILISPVSEDDLRTAYPSIPTEVRIFAPYQGSLSNGGETLTLNNKNGTIMTTVDYNDGGKWPPRADGTGHTLSRINPNLSNGEWRNWAASGSIGGTPGEKNPAPPSPALIISEVHFGPDGNTDWIELYSPHVVDLNVSPFKLSSKKTLSDAISLSGTIPSGGYLSFPAVFTPDLNGDLNIFLSSGTTVLNAVRLDRDHNEESFQSQPVGEEFYGSSGHTQNAPNDPVSRETGIVINEIMYDAPSDQRADEYIELYNRSDDTIDLSGWRFTSGISFDFPAGTSIAADSYLVIAADAACLLEAHPGIPVIGDWTGTLRDRGELIRLVDAIGNLVDEVDYLPEGDWPNLADGDGSSMELRHPDMDNNVSTAWADSEESQKSTMQTFTFTENFRRQPWNSLNNSSAQELQAHLVGDSHLIIENVSLKKDNSGTNLVANGDIMSPTSDSGLGWVCQGTHWASFMDDGKLNLISDGHGDNKANRAEVNTGAMQVGDRYTLTFDARWVSGKSRLIFQTLDHGFGTSFLLPIPKNLGTPGAPNSQAHATAAPTVNGVIHRPAVPSNGVPVTVSARIDSAAALSSVELVHRLDTSTGDGTWLRTPMTDNGTGLYSATVSNFTAQGNIIQFYVEAKAGDVSTFQPRYGENRPAMWIVDNRDMPDQLSQKRFIISAYDRRALTTSTGGGSAFAYNFPRMSNHFFNATFIANESEIYYNAEIRKSGSPFTRATNAAIDHGKWKLPGDRLFQGRRRSVIDASGTPQGSNTPRFYDDRIARYFLYQLGHPVNEMEFNHVVVNTDSFRLREDHEPISNDFLNRNFEDGSDGTLLRIDDEWRFITDNGETRDSRNADWSYKDTDNPVAYHSEWLMRTRESDYDYGSFIELIKQLDANNTDEEVLDRITDSDMLALNATVRGYDADWDTITVNRGKNAYFYRPKDGKGWMLLHWDGDRVFERSGQAILGNRSGVSKYFAQPFVRRQMFYYMTKLLNEHTKDSARTQAWMQAEADSVAGTDIVMPISHYTNWFTIRENLARNFIGSSVANTNFTISTSNAATTDHRLTLTGTSPPTVFKVRVIGQDHTSFKWTSTTEWELSNIILKSGVNTLEVEGYDHDGNIIETEQFVITKTNNAPPVILVDSTPKSLNVEIGQLLSLDGSLSFDPDGSPLTFTWAITPEYGSNLTSNGMIAFSDFTEPGTYLLTVTVTDLNQESTSRVIPVSVFGQEDFSSFGQIQLDPKWNTFKGEKHGNSSSIPHYTLQDHSGRLTINIPLSHTPVGLPEATLPSPVNYLQFGSTWKYDESNDDLTGIFAQPDYDDSAWPSGPGYLGFGESGLPAPGLQTDTLQRGFFEGLITYYFRTEFEFNEDPAGALLTIDHIVDDGVRYYLNGQVIGNVRLPEGVIDSNTPGSRLENEDVVEDNVIALDVSNALLPGSNVLAAEVHNQSAGSSDLVFGARVDIAANPLNAPKPSLDDTLHPWIRRTLPNGDWTLQTEVKLEKVQFGQFYAGLLVEAEILENPFRYGIGFKDGTQIVALSVNPSGTSGIIANGPKVTDDLITLRLEKKDQSLLFSVVDENEIITFYEQSLPAGSSFSTGGIFASTETEQSLEASFDYAMLIDSSLGFTAWMRENNFTDPNAEYLDTGLSNILAYGLGRDLNVQVTPVVSTENGSVIFSHRQRLSISQLNYSVESSTDLENWSPAGDLTPTGGSRQNPDGTWTVDLMSNLTISNHPETYYRLIVTLP